MRQPDPTPAARPPSAVPPLRIVLLAAVVIALAVLGVVAASRPRQVGVGVGGPTGQPSRSVDGGAAGSSGTGSSPSGAEASGSGRPSAGAAAFDPSHVAVTLEPVVGGLSAPLAIANAGDGSGRLFIAEQGGQVRIVRDGTLQPKPFLDVGDRITSGGERGLLGLAFAPGFPDDPRVFVDYTDANGDTQVSSFTLAPPTDDQVDPASETRILSVKQPFANHNGGALLFDPQGMLLISLGDGGSGGDPQGNGQSLGTLLGKILRIDVTRSDGDRLYAIPPDNPFRDGANGRRPEIWLWGLRNPWRMSIDRATGDLWIGDVGQNAWEEVDVQRAATAAGTNFGWNRMEGTHCYQPEQGCEDPALALPVSDYGHDLGCTVIGGYVDRGAAQPALAGGYLFGDYCSGRLFAIDPAGDGYRPPVEVGQSGRNISAFGEDEAGELYATDISEGSLLLVKAAPR